MYQAKTLLMQSKYYHPSFNSAIFDGPLKIYFAQHQEGSALDLYFHLMADKELQMELKKISDQKQILILIYPNFECFQNSFEEEINEMSSRRFGKGFLIGIPRLEGKKSFESVSEKIRQGIKEFDLCQKSINLQFAQA